MTWHNDVSLVDIAYHILRKIVEEYQNSFDYITFEKIISKQSTFVFDRTTNLLFSNMQNEIYGPLVTIPYHAKCNNPFYQKMTSNKTCFYIFCCKPNLVIANFLIPATEKVHIHLSVIAQNNATIPSTKICR